MVSFRAFDDLRNRRATWQVTVIILTLFFGPLVGVLFVAISESPNSFGPQGVDIEYVCGALLFALLILSALAIWSRMRAAPDPARRWLVIKRLLLGLALIILAIGATLFSINFGAFSLPWGTYCLVPIGLYFSGIASMCRAVASDIPYKPAAPRGIPPQTHRPFTYPPPRPSR